MLGWLRRQEMATEAAEAEDPIAVLERRKPERDAMREVLRRRERFREEFICAMRSYLEEHRRLLEDAYGVHWAEIGAGEFEFIGLPAHPWVHVSVQDDIVRVVVGRAGPRGTYPIQDWVRHEVSPERAVQVVLTAVMQHIS